MKLFSIIATLIVIMFIIFVVVPYYCGSQIVNQPKSSSFWYRGACINKLAGFYGARNALDEKLALRGFSSYYFYMLAKERSQNDKEHVSNIINDNTFNIRDAFLASALSGSEISIEFSEYDLDYEIKRDKPLKMIYLEHTKNPSH